MREGMELRGGGDRSRRWREGESRREGEKEEREWIRRDGG